MPAETAPGRPTVRDLADGDRPWVRDLVASTWGLPVVTPAASYARPDELPGVVARRDGAPIGVVTYAPGPAAWEIVTVNALVEGAGAGRAMVGEVGDRAWAACARRVWLITTDTNAGAIAFYERIGMTQVRVHERFIDTVRRVKPQIDPAAFTDAIEFEWLR